MSFPTYKQYKESGFQWLGVVPDTWEVNISRRYFYEIREPRKSEDVQLSATQKIGVVPQTMFMEMEDQKVVLALKGLSNFKHVEPDDFVISLRSFQGGIERSKYQGCVSPAYTVLRQKKLIDPNFISYVFKSTGYIDALQSVTDGIREGKNIKYDQFANLGLVLPSVYEQKKIVTFLDHETAKIDTLVVEQEKLIGLLKEKRQAVISHAVTKGVEPSVKKKNSGVEWLGEVPEHWKILKIKRLSAVQRGASPRPIDDPKYFDAEGEYGWVRISDVSSSNGVLRNTEQKLSVLGSSLSVKIEPKQLFISIAGTVGKPCISGIKACIHDGFVYFPTLQINPWWLFRIFEAGVCYGGLGKLGTQLNLNTDTVGSISIGVPPTEEIESILSFIKITLEKFDGLIFEAHKVINLSLERRSSLISAAVTGKIDVRNYQPKDAE